MPGIPVRLRVQRYRLHYSCRFLRARHRYVALQRINRLV